MDLQNVELMVEGVHNDIEFRAKPEFEAIVQSFVALELSGRLPIKFGHGDTEKDQPFREGLPALGWIHRVWVDGTKLMADLTDIPKVVYDAIKAGLYRFVSVELLKNVKAGTRIIPWVLDGVALLGADPPAVGSLKDLQSLTMARGPKLQAESRFTFSREGDSETVRLRREYAKLQQQLIHGQFETAIQSGRILPRDREAFRKRYGESATVEDATAWIESSPKPAGFSSTATTLNEQQRRQTFSSPIDEMVHRTRERIVFERKEFGRDVSYADAARLVIREDPEFARQYMDAPSTLARSR